MRFFDHDAYVKLAEKMKTSTDSEAAIVNVRLVNRLAQLYGVAPLFTGDDKERLQVADFCLDVVVQIFQNRMM